MPVCNLQILLPGERIILKTVYLFISTVYVFIDSKVLTSHTFPDSLIVIYHDLP